MHQAETVLCTCSLEVGIQAFNYSAVPYTHEMFSGVYNGARGAKTSPRSDDGRQSRAGRQGFCCRLASNASNIFSVADYCSVVSLSVVDIPLSSVKSDA